ENPDTVLHGLDTIMGEIQSLCGRHDFARFLLLFRKMPHHIGSDLLRALGKSEPEVSALRVTYTEAALFGTNCILKFCRHLPTFQSNSDRYRFAPADEELQEVVRMFFLCTVHRWQLFYMNSIMRREMVEAV